MTKSSYTTAKELVLQALTSSKQTGLSVSQVTIAGEQFGWNELATVAPEPAWKKFLAQFSGVVVWIVFVAAFISGAMGEWRPVFERQENGVMQELPFDADRKAMSVLRKNDSGHRVQYSKGPPAGIVEKCVSEREITN